MAELISVVIPVYNVEKYLQLCVDSVVNQTYKNLEIILVDDGSTDKSGTLCDQYAQKDQRITVIHQKNGGPSEARNHGIESASGKYITFVDSDDRLDRNLIQFLYRQIIEFQANISCCRYKRFTTAKDLTHIDRNKNSFVCDAETAIKTMLYYPEKIPQSGPAKLYKKELFDTIKYPVGRKNEDIAIIYKLFYEAGTIVWNPSQYYFYYQRANSRVRSKFSEESMDAVFYAEEIIRFVDEKMPELHNAAICYALSQNVQVLLKVPYKDKSYNRIVDILKKNIKKYRKTVLLDHNVTWKRRLGALITYTNISLIRGAAVIYKRLVNKEKII